jgi:hypothetical protein
MEGMVANPDVGIDDIGKMGDENSNPTSKYVLR